MPWGDRTGPMGMGPMTGRGAGFCGGFAMPGYANPVPGRGFRGRGGGGGRGSGGGGRGFRNRYYATGLTGWQRGGMGWAPWGGPPPYAPYAYGAPAAGRDQEVEFLKSEAERLQGALSDINARISALSKDEEPAGQ